MRQARAVIVTTSDDLTNLDAAITARELNRDAKIVIRLFDETLATKVAGAFSMPTISTSQVAAPAFIAAATGRKIYQGFQLAGQYVHFTDMTICPTGKLVGVSVGEIQADKRINIVMQQGTGGVNVNPDPDIVLEPGDTILVIAPMEALLTLESMNHPHEIVHHRKRCGESANVDIDVPKELSGQDAVNWRPNLDPIAGQYIVSAESVESRLGLPTAAIDGF